MVINLERKDTGEKDMEEKAWEVLNIRRGSRSAAIMGGPVGTRTAAIQRF